MKGMVQMDLTHESDDTSTMLNLDGKPSIVRTYSSGDSYEFTMRSGSIELHIDGEYIGDLTYSEIARAIRNA